jgi:hypothetical protein
VAQKPSEEAIASENEALGHDTTLSNSSNNKGALWATSASESASAEPLLE